MISFPALRLGYDPVLKKVETAFHKGRMPHAWLFSGPRGVGKRTISLAIAHLLLGKFSSFESMEKEMSPAHPLVRHIEQGCHPELMVLSPQASVQEVRDLKYRFNQTSLMPSWRIGIILEADRLSSYSISALLKLIETPPPSTLFLITATGAVPKTLFSRCVHQPLVPLDPLRFSSVMQSLGLSFSDPLFNLLCQGCVGRAHVLKDLFPLARQAWDLFSSCVKRPCLVPEGWAEFAASHLMLFQEVFFLWCHQAMQDGYEQGHFLRLCHLWEQAKEIFSQHRLFHTDPLLILHTLCASIGQVFSGNGA